MESFADETPAASVVFGKTFRRPTSGGTPDFQFTYAPAPGYSVTATQQSNPASEAYKKMPRVVQSSQTSRRSPRRETSASGALKESFALLREGRAQIQFEHQSLEEDKKALKDSETMSLILPESTNNKQSWSLETRPQGGLYYKLDLHSGEVFVRYLSLAKRIADVDIHIETEAHDQPGSSITLGSNDFAKRTNETWEQNESSEDPSTLRPLIERDQHITERTAVVTMSVDKDTPGCSNSETLKHDSQRFKQNEPIPDAVKAKNDSDLSPRPSKKARVDKGKVCRPLTSARTKRQSEAVSTSQGNTHLPAKRMLPTSIRNILDRYETMAKNDLIEYAVETECLAQDINGQLNRALRERDDLQAEKAIMQAQHKAELAQIREIKSVLLAKQQKMVKFVKGLGNDHNGLLRDMLTQKRTFESLKSEWAQLRSQTSESEKINRQIVEAWHQKTSDARTGYQEAISASMAQGRDDAQQIDSDLKFCTSKIDTMRASILDLEKIVLQGSVQAKAIVDDLSSQRQSTIDHSQPSSEGFANKFHDLSDSIGTVISMINEVRTQVPERSIMDGVRVQLSELKGIILHAGRHLATSASVNTLSAQTDSLWRSVGDLRDMLSTERQWSEKSSAQRESLAMMTERFRNTEIALRISEEQCQEYYEEIGNIIQERAGMRSHQCNTSPTDLTKDNQRIAEHTQLEYGNSLQTENERETKPRVEEAHCNLQEAFIKEKLEVTSTLEQQIRDLRSRLLQDEDVKARLESTMKSKDDRISQLENETRGLAQSNRDKQSRISALETRVSEQAVSQEIQNSGIVAEVLPTRKSKVAVFSVPANSGVEDFANLDISLIDDNDLAEIEKQMQLQESVKALNKTNVLGLAVSSQRGGTVRRTPKRDTRGKIPVNGGANVKPLESSMSPTGDIGELFPAPGSSGFDSSRRPRSISGQRRPDLENIARKRMRQVIGKAEHRVANDVVDTDQTVAGREGLSKSVPFMLASQRDPRQRPFRLPRPSIARRGSGDMSDTAVVQSAEVTRNHQLAGKDVAESCQSYHEANQGSRKKRKISHNAERKSSQKAKCSSSQNRTKKPPAALAKPGSQPTQKSKEGSDKFKAQWGDYIKQANSQ